MNHEQKGTALITGASSGIGMIYTEKMAKRGYDLILVARNRDRLNALAARLTSETRRNIEVIQADLANEADLFHVERKLREDASITLLINNAGIGTHTPLLESDVTRMSEMISLNVTAVTRLAYAAAPGFVARRQGAIINISSIVSLAPELLNGVYGGSKAYVTAFTQSLHRELSPHGVQIQAVLPGATATEFWKTGGLPVENLDPNIVMAPDALVDAALRDFDDNVMISIPSMHDLKHFETYEASRQAMFSHLSSNQVAPRYLAN